jgi:hypothetical protein
MNLLPTGHVIDGTYRIESALSATDRASVYIVSHARFPDVPLVLKIPAPTRTVDFERDTVTLSSVTSPCVARLCDRGTLPDGQPYRVALRLAGPTLREALQTGSFPDERMLELLVDLAATAHEAQECGLGPLDLSVDNLMFDGRGGRLCLLRALAPVASMPSLEANQAALRSLRSVFEDRRTQPGAHEPGAAEWRPPSSIEEIRAAMGRTGKPRTPMLSSPGANIGGWEVARRVSETLHATVYEVKKASGQVGVLKIAGPETDPNAFIKHADLLARVQSRHVVRVVDYGKHEDTPFMVMDPLHLPQSVRLQRADPLGIDSALQTIDELLWGAEAVGKYGGSPSDFSLEHCFQATADPSPSVLTHVMVQLKMFGLYGRPEVGDYADAWSAAVALYELIAGRLPFPTSRHSLAKAWMGMPIPLSSRRRDVPADISDLVHAILTGKRMKTAELRRELTRIRSAPRHIRASVSPSSVPPRASAVPAVPASLPPVRVFAATEHGMPRDPKTPPPPPPPAVISFVPAPVFQTLGSEDVPVRRSIEPPPVVVTSEGGWSLAVEASQCPLTVLSAAAIGQDGEEITAVGQEAIARWRKGQWTLDPARDTAGRVRSLVPLAGGGCLALTGGGPLLRLGASGGLVPWGVTLERLCFLGATEDAEGVTLVGGTRDTYRGVVARLVGETITVVNDALDVKPLRAATHLRDGSLLAVSEGGTIVRLVNGRIVEQIRPCNADLHDARVIGDDVVVVGSGAWAFRVVPSPLAAELERVDTLSALTCIAVSGNVAWVGTNKGRILRRTDRHWRRMSPTFEGDPAVLAVYATPRSIHAMLADGHVVLGTRA